MFASASHEFRTPLNAILNSFNFLKNSIDLMMNNIRDFAEENYQITTVLDKNYEIISKFIKIGSNSSTLLLALVEDILNLSKMDAGIFEINLEDFSINELITEIYEMFENQCHQKNVKLLINMDPYLKHLKINSDKSRLKQVFLNLLSNAYKFTFEGSIEISAQCTSENGLDMIKFKIQDTGIGIKEEEQANLFTLFGMVKHQNDLGSIKHKINPNG